MLWWEIQFAHKVLSIECSKSKTKSEHKELYYKCISTLCIVWWKSQFAHKGEYSNWGKTRNMEGRTLFQKTPTLFLWKCQNLAFHPIQIKWQRFEEEKTKLWNDQKTLQVSTLTHSHSLSCQPHCLPSFPPVYSEISKIKYCHLSPTFLSSLLRRSTIVLFVAEKKIEREAERRKLRNFGK